MKKNKKKKNEEKDIGNETLNRESENEQIDDVSYVEEDEFVEESGMQNKLRKLREKLEEEKKKSQEYLIGWQKERADFANYRTKEKERNERLKHSVKIGIFSDILPVLDSFDMAFSNRDAWEKVDASWRTGIEYIYDQFLRMLENHGVKKISQTDIPFDPKVHEPVEMIPTDEKDKDHLVESIVQTGYSIGDNVLRPAKVKVYELKKQ